MVDRRVVKEENTDSFHLPTLLNTATQMKASDIHIEPGPEEFRIRVRVDGRMEIIATGPMEAHGPLLNRLKIQCGMDITERRKPQDGGFSNCTDGHAVDFRVSIVPVADGEKAAIRILDERAIELDYRSLGLRLPQWEKLTDFIGKKYGLVVISGPTGSGKTTSMYTLLKQLNTTQRHIITLEDPVEYRLAGINQICVNERVGLTFAHGLRAILRQDPEVIMVGEIRDAKTAEIAVRAAITGHLVLTTLHTNDSHGAITRLLDMGVETYLIAAALSGVCSQRLVRRLCGCKEERSLTAAEKVLFEEQSIPVPERLFTETGCARCRGGFSGRIALAEVLPVTDALRDGILAGETTKFLKQRTPDFETLLIDGLRKAAAGETTIGEVVDAVRE